MSDYSYDEIMRMQNDAVRRVEEMQKRVREASGADSTETLNTPEAPRRIKMPNGLLTDINTTEENKTNINGNKRTNGIESVLQYLKNDTDVSLILSLIMLLSEENADETLLLSLLYILT